MTWAIVDRVFRTKIGEGGAAKAVLLSLANHCDEHGGKCYPNQETIQIETGLSLDTIQRQLANLELGEWIKRKKRPGVRGRWASWTYQINLAKLIDQAASCGPVDQAAPRGPDNSDQAASCGFTKPHHAA
ncbi:helix-turn-helix domain-containing protein [Bradyrhizobium barranii subsp. apii]|uniref:helix-turn-helix domain-containing protein n=1 Tax=Bradyrhizobium barranii TaxID=2992140 RepID=UPI001AA13BB7|nr:helix-turn-helix domain-containing protein [Bradyrhizobium barranii]UPT98885.1 helix-turn-helix domain-containing protein [Bradyrhizobium barranii subsp. apii]